MDSNEQILIGTPASKQLYSDFAESLVKLSMARPDRIKDVIIESGHFLVISRNLIVENFLKTEIDWLLFLDSDVTITLENFDRLIESADRSKYPILGGKCFFPFGRTEEIKVNAMKLTSNSKLGDSGIFLEDWKDGEIIDNLHSLGMNFVIVHRSIFEKIRESNPDHPYPWFNVVFRVGTYGSGWIGEDVWFFEKARELGFSVALHTGVTSTHLNRSSTTEEDFYIQRERR